MSEQRVSMFVSHKVGSHRRAAGRIKAILESRTERLDIYICEEIPAGDRWREWIEEHISHSQILLVLLPAASANITWIVAEIGRFQAACPAGRLIILRHPSVPIPDFVGDRQIVDASKEELQRQFLEPLYRHSAFTGLDAPLNPRVTEIDLGRDAQDIEDALLGIVDSRSELFGESLVVESYFLDGKTSSGLGSAIVRAPNGCSQILNWNRRSFSWDELRARAAEDKGKGTFWVTEMEHVITDVAQQNRPMVMTSTFRGRGTTAGQIFKPQLNRVDFVDDRPVRYHFVFYEVLVPELVRGPEQLGEVFNLLHIATRVRWEVFNPFLVNLSLAKHTPPSKLDLSPEAQHELIGRVSRSLRIIELEAERHQMLHEAAFGAFEGNERELVAQLFRERALIKAAIHAAADRDDFEQLMEENLYGVCN